MTYEQKRCLVTLNHWENQFSKLIDEDDTYTPRSFEVLKDWISDTLELDFKSVIYNNPTVVEKNRKENVSTSLKEKYGNWFIGDVLMDIAYAPARYCDNTLLDILEVDRKLKEAWSFFCSLDQEDNFDYIDAGVTLNGEVLYKRVTK